METVSIVGGGFSGVAIVLQLIRQHKGELLKVNVIEKRNGDGIGTAYSTRSPHHLLNVPAGRMGVYPDDPGHFYRWLQANHPRFDANDFVPRKIYCEYLNAEMRSALAAKANALSVERISGEAVSITKGRSGYEITLRDGRFFYSDKVVLALGNFAPANPPMKDMSYTSSPRYFNDPWSGSLNGQLTDNDNILLIGTGLTMVDMLLDLYHTGFKGRITAISRHGFLPFKHVLGDPYPSFQNETADIKSLQQLYDLIRKHHALAKKDGINWRAVLDSIRPFTQELWLQLPVSEKKKFLRHLNSMWSVLRHRIAPQCQQVIDELKSRGQLKVYPARLMKFVCTQNNINVSFRIRGTRQLHACDFSYVLNCTGPQGNYNRVNEPLVKQLLREGMIQGDALGMGLNATPEGKIIDRNGNISDSLLTIGPALRGILGESTAVPEIRKQAEQLANLILLSASRGIAKSA